MELSETELIIEAGSRSSESHDNVKPPRIGGEDRKDPAGYHSSLKALLVLTEPPLPFGGAASRWYYVLATELIRRGASVKILCCSGGDDRDQEAAELLGRDAEIHFFSPQQRRGLRRLASLVHPLSHLFSSQMQEELYSLDLEGFDIIQFETHFSGWLVDKSIDHAVMNVHSLFAIDHQRSASTLRGRLAALFLLRAERKMLNRFQRLSALTPRLSQRLNEMVPGTPVVVCPMSVDLKLYDFEARPPQSSSAPCIGMIGSFHWGPTQSAGTTLIRSIWPVVKSQLTDATLMLVGRQADEFCSGWDLQEDMEVHTDVPDSLPFFRRLDVMVYLPTVGSGMKVKVIESIALGTPVVTNAEGGEGLPEEILSTICVSDEAAAVERIVWLVRHPEEAWLKPSG